MRDLLRDDATLETGVDRDLLERSLDGDLDDVRAGRLLALEGEVGEGLGTGLDEGHATTGDDALLDGGLGVAHGVLDAVLALLELDLGGRAGLDDGDATGRLGEALLELLAVVVGVGLLDLRTDLVDPPGDLVLVAGASTIVVSSLVTTTLQARPSRSRSAVSSRPTSSEMTWPPVRMAMSPSMALRRSPKPGALTATDLKVPRILLTTSVDRASPSTSSEMMSSGLPDCMTFSRRGSRSLMEPILEFDEDVGVSSTASMRSVSVTK